MRSINLRYIAFIAVFLFGLGYSQTEKSEEPAKNKVKSTVVDTSKKSIDASKKQVGIKKARLDNKIRIAVVDLISEKYSKEANMLSDTIRAFLAGKSKIYKVLNRSDMIKDAKAYDKKIPKGCVNTRCLAEVGKLLNLDKIIGGELTNDGKYFALELNMVDVPTGKSEAKTWLASECTSKDLPELAEIAIFKLHNKKKKRSKIRVINYKGPEFSRHGLWAVTTGFTIAAGLVYSIIDGGLVNKDENRVEIADADKAYESNDNLSGIAGAFANLGYGARAHALGNAYVAVSNDASGILWNPAGLSRVRKSEVSASYLKTFIDIPYVSLGYVSKFSRNGGFGAALLSSPDSVYGETEFISSWAMLFNDIHPSLRPFSIGMNLKIREASTKSVSGIGASTGNTFGISFDLGLQMELADHIQMGLLFRNILEKQKWNNTASNEQYQEGTPSECIIGGAFKASPSLFLVMDGHIPLYDDQEYKLGMGIEKKLFDFFALRTGINQNLSFFENRKITCGFGIEYQGFGCDASYEFAHEEVFDGSVRISTNWKY